MLNSMTLNRAALATAGFWLACAIPVSVLVSIAASQILLGAALLCLILSGTALRLPPVRLPLALFIAGTVVAWLASGDLRAGLPQIRKFYVLLVLLVVYSAVRRVEQVRVVVLACAGVAALSALLSFVQFWRMYRAAHGVYAALVGERITGFMSHWMTFGGEEMMVLLLAAAFVFFARAARVERMVVLGAVVVLLVSMLLGLTRSVWLGTLAGGIYLIWIWRRVVILAIPVLLGASMLFVPVRERAASLIHPHGDTDSNQFRFVVWSTGLRMIRAHPWLGLGPEEPRIQFQKYLSPDVPRPLPTGYYGHLHNVYLEYAAERGIPTMLFMLWLIAKVLVDCVRAIRRGVGDANARFILHGAIAAIIGILVVGFAEYNLGDSEVLTLFLTTVAFAYVAVGRMRAIMDKC